MFNVPTEIQRTFVWDDEQVSAAPEQSMPFDGVSVPDHFVASVAETSLQWLIAELISVNSVSIDAYKVGNRIEREIALAELADLTFSEFQRVIPEIDHEAYHRVMVAVELGRRVAEAKLAGSVRRDAITSSSDACNFCDRHFRRLATDRKQEEFHIVTLNTKNFVIATHQITVGTLDASLVHPREVFRPAIRDAASSIIAVHNHPSGDPTPSREDIAVTAKLKECGETLGIRVLDHIVVASSGSVSVAENRST